MDVERTVNPSRIGPGLLGSRQELSLCLDRITMARARRAKPEQPEGDQSQPATSVPCFIIVLVWYASPMVSETPRSSRRRLPNTCNRKEKTSNRRPTPNQALQDSAAFTAMTLGYRHEEMNAAASTGRKNAIQCGM